MTVTVADIMTMDVVALTPDSTLRDAHETTRRMGIRHLPIVDPDSKALKAIVTQKAMISKVVSLLTQHGSKELEAQEKQTNIMELAVNDYETVSPTQTVSEIARFFLENKHGCLPVVDAERQLVGIVTSSDFVKLAVSLLAEKE